MPKMVPVSSSNLAAVGYEGSTLYIQFHTGGFYRYFDVPPSVYEGLMKAPSHGRFFLAHIKNVYKYQKL